MQRREYTKAVAALTSGAVLAGCTSGDGSGGSGSQNNDSDTNASQNNGSGDNTSQSDTSGGKQAQTVELWHDKGKNPNWNPVFEAATPALNEYLAEDNVEVNVVPYQNTDGYQGALRPVLGKRKGPGVFSWWTGQRLKNLVDDNYALDITAVWDKHIETGQYPKSLKEVYSFDGTAYAVPNQVNYWTVWYNKDTFNQLGVEPPSTWDEFRNLTNTIQSESNDETTPVILPLNPGWTGFIWFEEFVARQDPEFYRKLCAGNAKYTDETAIEALRMMGELQKDGVFGEASVSFSKGLADIPKDLESGDYAMSLIGSWISGVFSTADVDISKYDWFELPSMNSSLDNQLIIEPGPFVIHKGGASDDTLKSVADGLLSTKFRKVWIKELGGLPLNSEVDKSYLEDSMRRLANETGSGKYKFPLRYWENTSPEVAVPASKQMKEIFQSPGKAESIAKSLDQLRQKVYG